MKGFCHRNAVFYFEMETGSVELKEVFMFLSVTDINIETVMRWYNVNMIIKRSFSPSIFAEAVRITWENRQDSYSLDLPPQQPRHAMPCHATWWQKKKKNLGSATHAGCSLRLCVLGVMCYKNMFSK